MNVLNEIRPRAEHFTDEQSHQMLHAVMASDTRRIPPWRRLAVIGICGAVVTGGTAYATGLVPEVVSERFQQMAGNDGWTPPIYDERLVVDVTLSNGKHARVWHADTTDGLCEIRDMTGTMSRPEDFGVGCALWGSPENESDPRRGVFWQTSKTGPAVAYGDFDGVPVEVVRVDVAGSTWNRSFPVVDGSFGGQVPAAANGDRVRFDYVDASGKPIASEATTVGIESE